MNSPAIASVVCLAVFGALSCDESPARSSSLGRTGASSNVAAVDHANQRIDYSVHGLIVVLGSSTSAGVGPKDPKNAWVRRYKTRLAEQFPNVALVNLAVGGQTTFHIQPTDYAPPPNRPAPTPGKNITAALALRPSAIIVNMPSNDQASHYPLAEQLANYDRIASLTTKAHVPLWVSTTQPRNFDDARQLDELIQARDALYQKFAPRTLDFWTAFAAPNGSIKGTFNSGDGTHLNDAAHAILANIVAAAHIPEQFATASE
ncbi:MAG: SGNH/GDSL hydrolase family protein [Pseudomonadota bacterium]